MICCLWHVPTLPVSSGVLCMFWVKCKWIGLHGINDVVRIWVKHSGWYTTTSCAGHQISTDLLLENILSFGIKRGRIGSAHQNQNRFPTDSTFSKCTAGWILPTSPSVLAAGSFKVQQFPSLSVSRWHYRLNSLGLLSVPLWEATTDNTGQQRECVHSLGL